MRAMLDKSRSDECLGIPTQVHTRSGLSGIRKLAAGGAAGSGLSDSCREIPIAPGNAQEVALGEVCCGANCDADASPNAVSGQLPNRPTGQKRIASRVHQRIALVHESTASRFGSRRCSGLHALIRCFENKQVSVKSDSVGFDESPRLPLHGTEGTAHRNTMLNRRSRRAKRIRTPVENRETAFRTKNASGFVERRVTVDKVPDSGRRAANLYVIGGRTGYCFIVETGQFRSTCPKRRSWQHDKPAGIQCVSSLR